MKIIRTSIFAASILVVLGLLSQYATLPDARSQVTTKPSDCRTRRDSAPTPEKRLTSEGKAGVPGAGFRARETGAHGSRVSQHSAHACGSAIGRTILRGCDGACHTPAGSELVARHYDIGYFEI